MSTIKLICSLFWFSEGLGLSVSTARTKPMHTETMKQCVRDVIGGGRQPMSERARLELVVTGCTVV